MVDHFPKISVITPSYNQGQYLEDTIQSVISQKYPNLEYIIIDGGSSDNSVAIIKKYENNITFWVSEPDNGQSHAINKGLKQATGEIIAWINSDDQYCSGSFFTIAKYFTDNPDIGMIFGDVEIIDSNGKLNHRRRYKKINYNDLLSGYRIQQVSSFFKKSVIQNVGLLDESLHYCMDYDLWIRIFSKYPVDYIPQLFGRFRTHSESKTVSLNIFFYIELIDINNKLLSSQITCEVQKKLICQSIDHCLHLLIYLRTTQDYGNKAIPIIASLIEENTYFIRDIEKLIKYVFDNMENGYDIKKIRLFLAEYFDHYESESLKENSGLDSQKVIDSSIFSMPRIFLSYDRKMAKAVFKFFIRMDNRFVFDINFYILFYRLYCPEKVQTMMKPYLDSLFHTM